VRGEHEKEDQVKNNIEQRGEIHAAGVEDGSLSGAASGHQRFSAVRGTRPGVASTVSSEDCASRGRMTCSYLLIRMVKKYMKMKAGSARLRPQAVVMSATLTPWPRSLTDGSAAWVNSAKVCSRPKTVPRSPMSGATLYTSDNWLFR